MIIKEEIYFKRNLLNEIHAHASWKIVDKNFNRRGAIFFNWRLTTFNIEFHITMGKSGINIAIGLWGSFGFYYCWSKKGLVR
jgi:hypothetical protein